MKKITNLFLVVLILTSGITQGQTVAEQQDAEKKENIIYYTLIGGAALIYGGYYFLYAVPKAKKEAEKERIEQEAEKARLDALAKAGSLEDKTLKNIEFIVAENIDLDPWSNFNIGIKAVCNNITLTTNSKDSLYTKWEEYDITVTNGVFDNGAIKLNGREAFKSANSITITAKNKFHPEKVITKKLFLTFKGDYRFGFYGSRGESGKSGGSVAHTSIGGSKPYRGENGKTGGRGENGPAIDVMIDVVYDSHLKSNMLIIKLTNKNSKEILQYYVNTKGSKVNIFSQGGTGGTGGDGGTGGGYSFGYGATGGNGAPGGLGGNGGQIRLIFNKKSLKYKSMFTTSSPGGNAGDGGDAGRGGAGSANGRSASEVEGNPGMEGSDGYEGQAGSSYKTATQSFRLKR